MGNLNMIAWDMVQALRDDVGEAEFGEVVALFLEETRRTLDDLASAVRRLPAAGDVDPELVAQIDGQIHALRGSVLTMGFSATAEACRLGEGRSARREDAARAVDRIAISFAESRDAFLAGLA